LVIVSNEQPKLLFKLEFNMKAVTVKELRKELSHRSPNEILDLCLRLSRFKKENKELLTYLLFEAGDELGYIAGVKEIIDEKFELLETKGNYILRKKIRSILTLTKKYCRYSLKKETEVDLILHFCKKLKEHIPTFHTNKRLYNLYYGQLELVRKRVSVLHEDLQYDYGISLEDLENESFRKY